MRARAVALPLAAVASLERRLIAGIVIITLVLLVASTGLISQTALRAFEREGLPVMNREAETIGAGIAAQMQRAVALGIPPDRLTGLQPFFTGLVNSHATLDYVALVGPDGKVVAQAQRAGQPGYGAADGPARGRDVAIAVDSSPPIGVLHLGVSRARLRRSATDVAWDILVVLMVALLTASEILVFLTDRYVSTPLRQIGRMTAHIADGDWTRRSRISGMDEAGRFLSQLNGLVRRMDERWQRLRWLTEEVARQAPDAATRVQGLLAALGEKARFAYGRFVIEPVPRSAVLARAPLFLYVFAEQLSTSFTPLYARSLLGSGSLVPAQLAVGLPITAFAGLIAVASPWGARLVNRLGARQVLLLGCVPAVLGYALTAAAESVEAFTACRALTAVGYALITIACQGYLVEAGQGAQRGRNMATFVYAVMTGAVCGTAIGAILADRVGFRATFAVSAVLTAGVAALVALTMDAQAGRRPANPGGGGGMRGVLRDVAAAPRFAALVAFAAIPAKLVLTGFVFYIAPLYLASLQVDQPAIGRQIMLYGLTMLATIRLGAVVSDRWGASGGAIILAGVATGVGMMGSLLLPPLYAVPLAIVAVGLSQGLASAPMLAVVPDLSPDLAARLGVATLIGYLRFAERLGSIAGPMLAGVLVAWLGYRDAIAVIGAIALVTALLYAAVATLARKAGP